jgi:HEAT repeat protein
LIQALQDGSSEVRREAADALTMMEQAEPEKVIPILVKGYVSEIGMARYNTGLQRRWDVYVFPPVKQSLH